MQVKCELAPHQFSVELTAFMRLVVSQVQGLEMLTWLTQLSIEDNEIESLAGLSALSCLMELYIGNNNISQLREVRLS